MPCRSRRARSALRARTRSARASSRVVELAARLARRQRRLVARNDARDLEEVRVFAVRVDLAGKFARHELMVLATEVHVVRLELDLGRQLEALERLGELDRLDALRLR